MRNIGGSSYGRDHVKRFRQLLGLGAAVFALAAPAVADAQSASTPSPDEVETEVGRASGGLETIVVTARRREEGLQNTPISITAFSAEGIESRQIQQISGIAELTPSLTFEQAAPISGNSAVAVMFIRGIGQVESIPTVDLGVGLYVDGVYLARSVGGVLDLIDVERIEVLRGPQGTLFGRNTIGGAISITSVQPDDELHGSTSLLFGTDNHVVARASVNVPLAQDLNMRMSGAYTRQDGYVDHPFNGRDTGDQNRLSGRAHIYAAPTDSLELNLIVDITRERTNGAAYVLTDTNATGLYPLDAMGNPTPFPPEDMAAVFPFFSNVVLNGANCAGSPPPFTSPPPLQQCFGAHFISPGLDTDFSNVDNYSDLDIWGVSFTAEWDLGGVQLKSITAYRDTQSAYNIDQDHSPVAIAYVDSIANQWQFSQEIQLLGTAFNDRLSYILGGFYFKEEAESLEDIRFPVASFISGGSTDNESLAAFAQTTFNVTDRLSLTGGIRYTRDTKRFAPNQFVFNSLIGIPDNTPLIAVVTQTGLQIAPEDELVFSRWTPMANLSYEWSDNFMTYFTYSEGFKSGGFTQRVFPPVIVPAGQGVGDVLGFQPEIAEVFEIGFKSELLDGMVRLNGALFTTDYSGVQVTVQNVSVAPIILNAASADIWGGELELTAAPAPGLLFEAAVGYINAEYQETAPGAQVTVNNDLIKTPEWTLHAGASYEMFVTDSWSLTPRFDWSYRSRTENNSINSPQASQPGYHLLGAGLTFANEDAGFSVIARVENITNERYITGAFSDDISLGLTELVLDRGREWSVTLRKTF